MAGVGSFPRELCQPDCVVRFDSTVGGMKLQSVGQRERAGRNWNQWGRSKPRSTLRLEDVARLGPPTDRLRDRRQQGNFLESFAV